VGAAESIRAAEAQINAADAGVEAADSTIANARSGIDGTQADVGADQARAPPTGSSDCDGIRDAPELEQVVARSTAVRSYAFEPAKRTFQPRWHSARAARPILARAKHRLGSATAELEAQKRQRAVLDSQGAFAPGGFGLEARGLSLAKTNLGYTRIVAPEDGIVSERKVRAGQLVSPGTQVLTLVQSDVWVQANYRERKSVTCTREMVRRSRSMRFLALSSKAKSDQVAPASGSQFALLPPDNATGNFTKIVQRVPVKIVLQPGQTELDRLRPGLSVIATIRANGTPH